MTEPDAERLHEPTGEGFADAVTFAWGDLEVESYGLLRLGIQPAEPARASLLGVVFEGAEIADVLAVGDLEQPAAGWDSAAAGALRFDIEEPLAAWRTRWDGRLDLRFIAVSPTVPSEGGGMQGYEQVCRVEGTVGDRRVACLGQRGHSWGVADWERMSLARTLSAWWDVDHALLASAIRPANGSHHSDEELHAHLLDGQPVEVAEPRLSTTYDSDGRQRRAGLELYVTGDDEEYPRRAAGQVACGTSLDLGRLRLDCAFFSWRMEGREGVGRYDVLRRA